MSNDKIALAEEELKHFMERREKGLPTKWEIEEEIEKFGETPSDPELNKEFLEFKKTLLNREDFSPTPIEIIDNSLTEKEIENYKVIICSRKYTEGIILENGKRIYPNREDGFYKERALIVIEWLRHNESDFDDYDDILTYRQTDYILKASWRDIAKMFLKEIVI